MEAAICFHICLIAYRDKGQARDINRHPGRINIIPPGNTYDLIFLLKKQIHWRNYNMNLDYKAGAYWSKDAAEILKEIESSPAGLSTAEAQVRYLRYGPNQIREHKQLTIFKSLMAQFTSPLVFILLFAAAISFFVGEYTDTIIVTLIVIGSVLLSFTQEYRASKAVEKMQSQLVIRANVLRDGKFSALPATQIVPGDIVALSAGSMIPGDGLILEAQDFFVNQAILTGESFPVEKKPGRVESASILSERTNVTYMGTNVRSGTAKIVIINTGTASEFGEIALRLRQRPVETEFERGIRKFGILLVRLVTVLILAVLIINLALKRPPIDSLLFAIALAVGVAPELLPAIITITLSKGAQKMAQSGVVVKKLAAIENLGGMDILCTDKTGTITKGIVKLDGAFDVSGNPDEDVMRLAYLNASFQTGIENPLDQAILAHEVANITGMDKLAEIPYDFQRKRLSVVIDCDPGSVVLPLLITKGALDNILAVATNIMIENKSVPLDQEHRDDITSLFTKWSNQGYRVLGLSSREVAKKDVYTVADDECAMTFRGFLLFFDPPKDDVADTIRSLASLGVTTKIITGDNHLVARHLADAIGLPVDGVVTASQIKKMNEDALLYSVEKMTVFAEVDPSQKERIILALKKMGHVVGYMGDGINDAPALHGADVGISVDQAVDVAKEAADFVLVSQDLNLIITGILEGRRTFANTLKYIFTTTSANFGNMLSMAGASMFLPFLPLAAKQILLNNFMSDIPAIGIPGDNVDELQIARPHHWDIRLIRNFMIIFGIVSSVFDYTTFALLLFVVKSTQAQFQSAWFIESLLSELAVALVVRTRLVFYQSRPGKTLLYLTLAAALAAFILIYSPLGALMGFVQLPLWVMAALVAITVLYVIAIEIAKRIFYRLHG